MWLGTRSGDSNFQLNRSNSIEPNEKTDSPGWGHGATKFVVRQANDTGARRMQRQEVDIPFPPGIEPRKQLGELVHANDAIVGIHVYRVLACEKNSSGKIA